MEAALEERDRLWLKRDMDVLPGVNRLGRVGSERWNVSRCQLDSQNLNKFLAA
jgi:hypothetical protein